MANLQKKSWTVSNIEMYALFFRQIKNRHGQTLAIMNNGEVRGVAEEAPANKNAVLEFIPTEPPGAYRIRGIQANLYLAMDAKGKLYGESDRTEGSTIFAEHTQNKVRNTRGIFLRNWRTMETKVVRVVEFLNGGYKIRKIFA